MMGWGATNWAADRYVAEGGGPLRRAQGPIQTGCGCGVRM